ncbi:MAG: ABC transporter permease [Candidatus Abyssubacteria bacterium]
MTPAFAKRMLMLGVLSIWRHRLRSTLTILGIVFGVCSVIAMLAIGEGASYEAQEQIKRLGSQNIILKSVQPPQTEAVSTQRERLNEYGLTYKDAERIRLTIPEIELVVPSRSIRADVSHRTKLLDANAIATVAIYPRIANRTLARGRFFTEVEVADTQNVCVLGAELARRLFPFENPIDSTVKVRGDYFTVIGILEESGAPSESEGVSTLDLYLPLTTAKARFGEVIASSSAGSYSIEKVELHELIVKVEQLSSVAGVANIIRQILKDSHQNVDYEILVPLELLNQAKRTKRIFNIVLGSIAAISLLVGGIGIMNIMLATVTERTREIGIRRALGAKRQDIVAQFLVETALLSGCGGAVGLAFGVLLPLGISHFAGMQTIIRLWFLTCAFGVSILIGLVFGIYPAYRAATLNPVTALRHE